jgi:hypothetical protein
MRWRGGRQSGNIEDRRGMGGRRSGMGGFPRGAFPGRIVFPGGGRGRGGGIGIVGLLVFLVLAFVFGIDPRMLLDGGTVQTPVEEPTSSSGAGDEELRDFVAVVLADTEDTWHALFREMGGAYQEPKLILFSGATQSGCGFAGAAVGPFYCGRDRRVYLDLGFFAELSNRFGAPGDFARAYVIAHEVGHHVQNLMGILDQVNSARARLGEAEANALSVRLELQADCFAGLWAHHAQQERQILEPGDIEEALGAASAVGDDRLQQQARGHVAPDSFTHGTAAQRASWFRRGFESGALAACDTFAAERV